MLDCLVCNKPFQPVNRHHACCGPECRAELLNKKREARTIQSLVKRRSFWCKNCGGPWTKKETIASGAVYCSEECKRSDPQWRLKRRSYSKPRDRGDLIRASIRRQPSKASKFNCAICLYRVGFGYTTISKKIHSPKNICRRWIILGGHEQLGRGSKTKNGRRWSTESAQHVLTTKAINSIIIESYHSELRAAQRPDRLWCSSYFPKPRTEADRQKENHRIKNDPRFRAIFYARKRIRNFLKQRGWNKNSSTSKAIGCSPDFLRDYIQRRFKPGMAWNNHGKIWHIDHVKPLASANSAREVMKLAHYSNLQPLFISENMAKGDKWIQQTTLPI